MFGVEIAPGVPCASCSTTGGTRQHRNSTEPPRRYNGKRFGFDGKLCKTCYAREMRAREAIKAGREPGIVGRPWPIPPCVKCGTPGGGHLKWGRPARYRTDAFGRPGPFCGGCWGKAYRERREAKKRGEQVDYLPDEATIAKRARGVRLLALGSGAVRPEEWEVERGVYAERARAERERARAERMAGRGMACVMRPCPPPGDFLLNQKIRG